MKYLLIRPRYRNVLAILEPLGLEYLAGVLNIHGRQYEIYDEFLYPSAFKHFRFKRFLKRFKPDVVCITAHVNTVDIICKMADVIKKLIPSCIVVVGGPHAELGFDEFFCPTIDYIYTVSSLESFNEAVSCDFKTSVTEGLPGICYREGDNWVVNEKGNPADSFLTKPDRSFFYKHKKRNYLIGKGSYALLKASFSCPFSCKFCYCCKMNSGSYREIGLDKVIEDIKDIGHDKIWIVDDTFLVSRERVIGFIEKIKDNRINKQFICYSRADFIVENEDILKDLRDAGVKELLVGIEACDIDYLKEYNKKTDVNVNLEAIRILRENRIICNGLFIVDHKFSKEDFKNMYKYIKGARLYWVIFAIFTPLKHTGIYDEYRDKLVNYDAKRLDFIHLVLKPLHMSAFMFYLRFYLLNIKVYIRLMFALIFNKDGAVF